MPKSDLPKITLCAPGRIKRYPKSTIARFYNRLRDGLEAQGHASEIRYFPYRVPESNGEFFVCYHTIANRADVLNAKLGYLNGYMLVDDAGYSGWSAVVDEPDSWRDVDASAASDYMDGLQSRYVAENFSRYFRMSEKDPDQKLPEGYVAAYLQCQDDTVMDLKRFSTVEMIESLLAQRGDRALVIKRHPLCEDEGITALLERVVDPENGVYQSQANVHEVTAGASAVACVNSGAGFDSLLHGKKVMVFGVSDYRHAAFEVTDLNDVGAILDAPGHSREHIAKYLYWYLTHCSVDVDAPDMPERVLQRIKARMNDERADPENWAQFPPKANAA